MKGQGLIELWKPVVKDLLHYKGDTLMYFLAFLFEKATVNHLLGQGVLEYIFQILLKRSGSNYIELFETS